MKNYIPVDFYQKSKTVVYVNKKACEINEKAEAIEFESGEVDLSVCDIINGELIIDPVKDQAKKDKKNADDAKGNNKKTSRAVLENIILNDIDSMDLVQIKEVIKHIILAR